MSHNTYRAATTPILSVQDEQTREQLEGNPYLVIAKRQYADNEMCSADACSPQHFFVFANDEGQAIIRVRELLIQKMQQAASGADDQIPRATILEHFPKYQFTVKAVIESQPVPSARVFSL